MLPAQEEGSFVKLRQLGNWETYFNFQHESYFFVSREDNVRPGLTFFPRTTLFEFEWQAPFKWNDAEAARTIPKQGMLIRQLLLWRGRNACQLFSLIFRLQTVDISVELTFIHHISLSPSCSISCNFLINFLCSMQRGYEASLQAHSSVSTGHNQSWWMWWTVNVCRRFSISTYLRN